MKFIGDLHCHLNGSFSMDYLDKVATRNGCMEKYHKLVEAKAKYQKKIAQYPDDDYPPEVLGLIWEQFGLIHEIIQTIDDIEQGVLDVAKHKASGPHGNDVIEIRSSPKVMKGKTTRDYIESFCRGMQLVKDEPTINARVYGLISLDRNHATFAEAQEYIEWIKASESNLICGLDISGNPSDAPKGKRRSLSGESLSKTIELALNSGIGMAIHMGEVQTKQEQDDIDIELATLVLWQRNNPAKKVSEYVRLGHCIYLTPEQKRVIRTLKLPIEVCPSCHSQINWHRKGFAHPATTIYPELPAPIVSGTDDECVFGGRSDDELKKTYSFFSKRENYNETQFASEQQLFSFINLKQLRDSHSSIYSKLTVFLASISVVVAGLSLLRLIDDNDSVVSASLL